MLKGFLINKFSAAGITWLVRIQLLGLLLFAATITLDQRINSFFLILVLFLFLPGFNFARLRENWRPLLCFTLYFVWSMISILWSENKSEGIKVIERQLALFFIPVLFLGSVVIHDRKFARVFYFYFAVMLVVSGFLIYTAAKGFLSQEIKLQDWFVKEHLYHAFAEPVGMHAVYLSLLMSMAVLIGLQWLLQTDRWWIKVIVFISILILVLTITLLSSRAVISTLILILLFVYPFFVGKLKSKPFLIVAGLIIALTFYLIIRQSSFISDRFVDKIGDEVRMTGFLQSDSTYKPIYGGENRADRWYCAIELVKEKPIVGWGTGSEKDKMMEKYLKYNLENAVINKYDAHNQYLAFGIKTGMIGLILFLCSVFFGFFVAFSRSNFLYISFMLVFSIACITENVIESNKGIFFYGFFNTWLYICSQTDCFGLNSRAGRSDKHEG